MINSYRKNFPVGVFEKMFEKRGGVFMIPYIMLIGGIVLGSLFTYLLLRLKTLGTLRVIESNEPGEPPYLFVELNQSVNEVIKRKHVIFDVSLK